MNSYARRQSLASQVRSDKSKSGVRSAVDPAIERFRWILENRQDARGRQWSATTLSIAAGMSHAHLVGVLAGRQSCRLTQGAWEAYARAARVRREWLQYGTGQRVEDLSAVSVVDALAATQPGRWSARAVAVVRAMAAVEGFPTAPHKVVEELDVISKALDALA